MRCRNGQKVEVKRLKLQYMRAITIEQLYTTHIFIALYGFETELSQ
jgi:hypothetical protein